MIINSQFKAAWWLTNAHAQTIYASIIHPIKPTIDKLEHVELPDGDYLELLWSNAGLAENAPLIIILHGLSGSVNSSYVARFMNAFNQQGWRAVVLHFRGAGKELNRLPRAYHSGDTADLDFIVTMLAQREPDTKKAIVGVSLGGNVLLKWLGEQGQQAKITTAVAVSVPFVLNKLADKMNTGFARLYQRRLLKNLKALFARKMKQLENPPAPVKNAAACDSFWAFDHQVTAPLHGFSSAQAYYQASSSRQYVKKIETPTLIIHSKDDPFMTAEVIPTVTELAESVTLELSDKGGHVGFITGTVPGLPLFWLDHRIAEFIAERFNQK